MIAILFYFKWVYDIKYDSNKIIGRLSRNDTIIFKDLTVLLVRINTLSIK